WAGTLFIGMLSLPVGLAIRMLPDLSACFGLESANSPAQQHLPEVSTARMHIESSVKDVQRAVKFFGAIRNAQQVSQAHKTDDSVSHNFLSEDPCLSPTIARVATLPSGLTTAAPTVPVSTSSSWTKVKAAVSNSSNNKD
ncbi:hypothetical protein GGF44_002832, partial [Coemansia sp. RSA 1694]